MRLPRDTYIAVQRIYYPGFTFMGTAEALGIVLTLVLLLLMPAASTDFYLVLIALLGLFGMQGVYWIVTHPVNKVWLQGETLSKPGKSFFAFGATGTRASQASEASQWNELRDRWEYSHVARAALAGLSLVTLVIGIR